VAGEPPTRLKQRVYCPFVCLLKFGGFLYFDSTYDIVAANSISFDEVQEGTSALYLGTHSDLPAMVRLVNGRRGGAELIEHVLDTLQLRLRLDVYAQYII
jgi:hypothetical protein